MQKEHPYHLSEVQGEKYNIICSEDKETYLSTNSICSIDLCQWKYNGKKKLDRKSK